MNNESQNQICNISVVIPVYNSGKTLIRAIDSVIKQTCPPFEIIVVDDGSKDNSCELIERYFPSVKLIRQKNAGAAAARNTGVRASTGNLIAFLDADDFWHRKKLEYQQSIFLQFQTLGISSTQCMFVPENEALDPEQESQKPLSPCAQKMISFDDVFSSPFLGTPSVMIKRSLFEKLNGFDERLETAEDVDLWIRATYISEYRLIMNPLTCVVGQVESLSSRARLSPYEAHLNVMTRFVEGKPFSLAFKLITLRKTRSLVYGNWGSTLLVNGHYVQSLSKFLNSFFQCPNFRAIYLFIKAFLKMVQKGNPEK